MEIHGTSITQVQAKDEDHGEDGTIIYSISTHSDLFTIDNDSGIIRPVTTLDRETTGSYLVEIHAIDQSKNAKQTGTTTLTVVIDDVNEEGPLCKTVASVEVPSSSIIGDLVYKLKCSDSDVGPNGDLAYAINKGNTNLDFTIDSQGRIVVAKVLSKPAYNLEVIVFDGGIPPKKSPVHIEVNVIGEPKFLQLPKTLDINEDEKIGNVIYVVKSTSKYQFMRFAIKSGNSDGIFGINDVSGDIYLISKLDREQTPSYTLTLQLTDNISKLSSTGSVNIRVKDSNDNIPTFDNNFYEFSVVENIPIKTSIALTVFAEDAGYPSRTATAEVVVNIIDVKDTKPYEDKPATYFSLECAVNAHNGDSLTTFTPHDFGIYQSLADPIRSKSLVYVVKDRSTDTIEGIQNEKSFLTQNDILKVLRRSDDGTPAYPLESKSFDTFPVNSVSPYKKEESSPPSWFQTDVGIAVVLTIIFSLILLAIILTLYFYCTRESSDGGINISMFFEIDKLT
ncbi:protocadherin-like protein [Mytilus californianus]|uniref:protocadherin-like protein n=1 Tax=Mytilus californianus TaxID=6549 RepID=UPI00224523F1|nr:protocadherin-like protein [Mytilus californianus]